MGLENDEAKIGDARVRLRRASLGAVDLRPHPLAAHLNALWIAASKQVRWDALPDDLVVALMPFMPLHVAAEKRNRFYFFAGLPAIQLTKTLGDTAAQDSVELSLLIWSNLSDEEIVARAEGEVLGHLFSTLSQADFGRDVAEILAALSVQNRASLLPNGRPTIGAVSRLFGLSRHRVRPRRGDPDPLPVLDQILEVTARASKGA